MQLTSIEILNLWGQDKITLSFDDRVTFLTGINGSGKSSLLNIIYDTLNLIGGHKLTSKNRFWSARLNLVSQINWLSKKHYCHMKILWNHLWLKKYKY